MGHLLSGTVTILISSEAKCDYKRKMTKYHRLRNLLT